MMWDDGMSWLGWTFMSLLMIAFWAFVIWAVVAVVGSLRKEEPRPTGDPDPEQILARRFARGEIDADEYHRRLEAMITPEHSGDRGGKRPTVGV